MERSVDASIALQLVIDDAHSRESRQFILDAVQYGDRLTAPPLILPEAVNAIRKRVRGQHLTLNDGQRLMENSLALPIDVEDEPGIARRALDLSLRHSMGGHDAYCVAFAEARGCDLWVDDGRLLRAATALPFVRWIGSYAGR